MTWRDELKAWRKLAKLVQKEAADKLGVAVGTYRGWEYGNHEPAEYIKPSLKQKMEL